MIVELYYFYLDIGIKVYFVFEIVIVSTFFIS